METLCDAYTTWLEPHYVPVVDWVVTRMDTPKYGETLKFMYMKNQPILEVLPKVYQA